jgi:hypothetical protein
MASIVGSETWNRNGRTNVKAMVAPESGRFLPATTASIGISPREPGKTPKLALGAKEPPIAPTTEA